MSFRTRVACLIALVVASVTLVVTIGFLYVADSQAKKFLGCRARKKISDSRKVSRKFAMESTTEF
jgi:hypothetical protein